jgi:probable phosphoglycerate mutase
MLRAGVTLYFVRHGETDWNVAQRYQGRRDIPLNATGRTQAHRNGRTLATRLGAEAATLDYVSSPLLRASETMEILRGQIGLPPTGYRTDERLAEIDYGHWEGQLWKELPAIDPEGFTARMANLWEWQPRGGESYRMLSERVAGWLADVDRNAIAASHGGVSRVLRGMVLGLRPEQMLKLEVPQDKVLVVTNSGISWI